MTEEQELNSEANEDKNWKAIREEINLSKMS